MHMEHAPTEIVILQLQKKCIPNLTEGLGGGLYIENPRVPSSHWFLN